MANFVGWGVVGLVASGLYHAWERRYPELPAVAFRGRAWICPGLYFGVLAFNLTITFALQEWWLGLCGASLALPVAAMTLRAGFASKAVGVTPRREGVAP